MCAWRGVSEKIKMIREQHSQSRRPVTVTVGWLSQPNNQPGTLSILFNQPFCTFFFSFSFFFSFIFVFIFFWERDVTSDD